MFSEKGTKVSGLEYRSSDRNGDEVCLSLNARIFYDENGRFLKEYGVARDITHQKELENKLQQAQRMEAIGALAGGIAHDFNNMLMGIQGRVSLMKIKAQPDDPSIEHLDIITQLVRGSSGLTKQLLGIAKGGKYNPKPTNLNEIIKRVTKMFGRTRKELIINWDLKNDLDTVEVDRNQFEQVLLNLFVNAWQAMPGGGALDIVTENVMLENSLANVLNINAGHYVKVSVADTGIGMDEETIKQVFDPFFTTKDRARGTGLGLSSAYGIIDNHGGKLTAASRNVEGSIFNIFLPASNFNAVPVADFTQSTVFGSGIVLLVDDEEIIIQAGAEILKALGYEALVARGGRSAVELYEKHHEQIDLVILDMVMPDMNGGKVYELLRSINPDVRVLLSSGYSSDGKASAIMKQGCDGFIQKPFTLEHLSQKIKEILTEN